MMVHSHGALPIDEITEAISGACQFEDWSRHDTVSIGKFLQIGGLFVVRTNQVQFRGIGGLMMFGKNSKILPRENYPINLNWPMMKSQLKKSRN